MATSRTTAQIVESGLGSNDLEANLSGTGIHSTAGRGAAARMFSCVGDLDEACFFVALCGLWTNTLLHALLVLSYLTQAAPEPTHESLCWSLAVVFWGIVALSVHSIRHASRASMTRDTSCTRSLRTQTRIAEALMLTVLIAWYRDAIAQKTSPYKELFSMCDSSARWEVGYTSVYSWENPLFGITLSQCDLANAIANVTWVGPIALLLAVWIMLLKWIGSPAVEVSENVANAAESVPLPMLKSVQSSSAHRLDCVGIKHLEGKHSAPKDAFFVD